MRWWPELRDDLAKPDAPIAVDERPFLWIGSAGIVAVAAVSEPGTAAELVPLFVAGLALALRGVWRRAPAELFALAIAIATGITVGVDGNLEVSMFLGVVMTLYAAWHVGSTTRAVAIAAVSATPAWVLAVVVLDDMAWTPWVAAHTFMLVLGRNMRRQRVLIEKLEAAQLALAEQAVLDERRRIARELHDLAGHTLAAVLLHVTGARHVLRRDVDEAERALRQAESVGRASLDQIRDVVAQLRARERGTDPALAGPADLAELVDGYRRAGMHIRTVVTGDVSAVDGPVATAVHRICREALANVAHHAPGNDVCVEVGVDHARAELRLVVVDAGRPPRPPLGAGGHFGLVGMRERALALGGRFEAGPTTDGWLVEAGLPLAPADGKGPGC